MQDEVEFQLKALFPLHTSNWNATSSVSTLGGQPLSAALGCQTTGTVVQLLSKLPVLKELMLSDVEGNSLWGQNPAAYTGMFSSTALESVSISSCKPPSGFFSHALSVDHTLPQLTKLVCPQCSHDEGASGWDTPAVQALAARAPNFQTCSLLLEAGAQLSPMINLSRLTALEVTAPVCSATTIKSIATLTGLQESTFTCRSTLSKKALLQLTALRKLTYLLVRGDGLEL